MNMLVKTLGKAVGLQEYGTHPASRGRRMRDMLRLLNLPDRARIIDLGGTESNWKLIDHNFHVTIVNLPGSRQPITEPESYELIEGDACDLRSVYGDNSFDATFSNSVIEHVGPEDRQEAFAREARRLAPAYWVQTPSPHFPLEAHTGLFFYWNRSQRMRDRVLDRWYVKYPGWVEMLRETRVLSSRRMRELFPDGQLYRECRFGIEKSNSMYRPYPGR
jgi:hypothetical protein